MPTTGPNLGLTISDTAGASGWDTWMNTALALLDAVIHLDVKSRVIATPPGSPAEGDRYFVAASPTGAWSGQAGKIALYRSATWVFITLKEGWLLTSQADLGKLYKYESSALVLCGDGAGSGSSLVDFKDSVRCATTAAGTLASSFENGDTVDGVTLATGNRILIKNQSTASENGIYTVNASGAPTRATDFDADAEVTGGCVIPVNEGTTNGDKLFLLTTNDPITVGSTSLTFTVLAAGGASVLDDLTDVVISGAASGHILEHNGSNFVNVFPKVELIIAASDESTALTTGTAKVTFRMPFAMTLTGIRASLSTAQASGSIFTVDVNEGGSTILSTKITIDNTEKTSTTAATAAVISDSALADDAEITIDIDQVGDGTAKGLKVTLIGRRA